MLDNLFKIIEIEIESINLDLFELTDHLVIFFLLVIDYMNHKYEYSRSA